MNYMYTLVRKVMVRESQSDNSETVGRQSRILHLVKTLHYFLRPHLLRFLVGSAKNIDCKTTMALYPISPVP